MSEHDDVPGSFLRRWSRRKRAAETRVREEGRPSESGGAKTSASSVSVQSGMTASAAFDLTHLPPIESITAASDVRAFLAPGVPVELSRAALRRAWMTDPAIRDFIGLAENQWDFTKPDAVPGFGPLELTPQVRRIIAELVADPSEPASRLDPDLQDVAQEAQKFDEAWPVATDQRAEVAERAALDGDAEKLAAGLGAPIVQSNIDAAAQREADGAREGATPVQRRHGSALPR